MGLLHCPGMRLSLAQMYLSINMNVFVHQIEAEYFVQLIFITI